MWDESLAKMSASYVKTVGLLAEGKTKEAAAEYKDNYMPAVKKLYTEVSGTYPARYAKTGDWCAWARQTYVLSRQAENDLDQDEGKAALEKLAALRKHFYELHEKTGLLRANDYIYAAHEKLAAGGAKPEEMKTLGEALAKAAPSVKAKAEAGDYQKAREAWSQQLAGALSDGQLSDAESKSLHAGIDKLNDAYGLQFE